MSYRNVSRSRTTFQYNSNVYESIEGSLHANEMNNLYAGSILALASSRRFVIATDEPVKTSEFLHSMIATSKFGFGPDQFCDIDLTKHLTGDREISDLEDEMCFDKGEKRVYRSLIVWRNVQMLDKSQQKKLVKFLTSVDQHKILNSRPSSLPLSVTFGNATHPEYFTIVLLVEFGLYERKLDPYLKEKFWYCVQCNIDTSEESQHEIERSQMAEQQKNILKRVRDIMNTVHVSHDIQRYIYSLIIFVRTHRLASLAPKNTRLPTATIESIEQLAKALTAWKHLNTNRHFVTPDIVKTAHKHVAYWLVDWEQGVFASSKDQADESLQKTQISILTGDWYGSKWEYARKYLSDSRSIPNDFTPTGFTNVIVEDSVDQVRPPI